MFLGRKNQYCENDDITECNLQIHCDPYQITNGIFHRTGTKNFTIHVETQKTPKAKAVMGKKNGAGRINLLDFRLYYKTTAIKPIRSVSSVQSNLRTHGYLFMTKEARIHNREKIASSTSGAGKT